ncbi:MAG: hypothetical protein OXU20_32795 [Myxococcales bacterium]|nr:hypothetical protein [Myxococcales bacterium]MDD9964602.1 hypothetical protein [Myxococcales bacterium]
MLRKRVHVVVLGLVGIALWACGGGGPDIQAGPMPQGGNFTGVFFSPQYGEMHMVQNGNTVRGEYKQEERTGKITGEADGDLLRFEWVELKAMVSNRPTETRGRGYFVYKVDPANGEHVLTGRWGLGDDEHTGGDWNAYKSKSREPELSEESSSGGEEGDDEYYDDDDFESADDDTGSEDDDLGGDDDLF